MADTTRERRRGPRSTNLVPMRAEDASALLERLLACYPALNLTNPKPYLAQLAELLCGYPKWAGEAAVSFAGDNCRYPPNRAELRGILEDQVRSSRYAATFGRNEPLLEPPREIRPSYDELKARYGADWGIEPRAEPVKRAWVSPTWEQIDSFYKANPERAKALVREREQGER